MIARLVLARLPPCDCPFDGVNEEAIGVHTVDVLGSGGRGGKGGGGGRGTTHSSPSNHFFSIADGLERGGVGMVHMASPPFFLLSSPFDRSLIVFPSRDMSDDDDNPFLSLVIPPSLLSTVSMRGSAVQVEELEETLLIRLLLADTKEEGMDILRVGGLGGTRSGGGTKIEGEEEPE